MSKLKIIGLLIFFFVAYKVIIAVKNFEIGVGERVRVIEERADFESEKEVIGLLMYLQGDLYEHLLTDSSSKCLEMKEIAEENSFAEYECVRVNAVLKGSKIVSIIEELEVIE